MDWAERYNPNRKYQNQALLKPKGWYQNPPKKIDVFRNITKILHQENKEYYLHLQDWELKIIEGGFAGEFMEIKNIQKELEERGFEILSIARM